MMDWKEFLAKFRLIDITPKVEGKQIGGVNVNVEDKSDNRTYNYHFHSAEAVRTFFEGEFKINPEFERLVKEEAERRLSKLGISPDLLSESTRAEIGSLTVGASAVDAIMFVNEDKLKESVTRAFEKPKQDK